jgi:hypothetical protein
MSQFLDTLKARLADAQQRFQIAAQKLQQAQAEHNAAMAEYTSWQNAFVAETKRENPHIQTVVMQPGQPGQPPRIVQQVVHQPQQVQRIVGGVATTMPTVGPPPPPQAASGDQINKTDLIRDVLRQHPNGITPADVWRQVKEQIGRAYVYSVLNRLKATKQVSERRGKYFLLVIAKTEEEKENTQVQ